MALSSIPGSQRQQPLPPQTQAKSDQVRSVLPEEAHLPENLITAYYEVTKIIHQAIKELHSGEQERMNDVRKKLKELCEKNAAKSREAAAAYGNNSWWAKRFAGISAVCSIAANALNPDPGYIRGALYSDNKGEVGRLGRFLYQATSGATIPLNAFFDRLAAAWQKEQKEVEAATIPINNNTEQEKSERALTESELGNITQVQNELLSAFTQALQQLGKAYRPE